MYEPILCFGGPHDGKAVLLRRGVNRLRAYSHASGKGDYNIYYWTVPLWSVEYRVLVWHHTSLWYPDKILKEMAWFFTHDATLNRVLIQLIRE